jgi:predicted membrane channel-forming protein YqfA (hemolysin III family)
MIVLRKKYHCGEIRPLFRGVLHSMISLLMFMSFILIYFENNFALIGTFFVFVSYLISSVFHLIYFENKIDYWINVLDHFGIQLHGIGMQMVSSNFKLDSISTITQIIINVIDSILCINIHNYITNIFHLLTFFISFSIGFFNTFGYEVFSNLFYFLGMIVYITGGLFYILKSPKSNEYWGYHELYHLFIAFGDLIFFYDAYVIGNL